jgi:D-glycero-D-manno-heptose 1,7-bisphosphate phosphatase
VRQAVFYAPTPAALLPCGDRPFLAWSLRELSRFGVEEALVLAGEADTVAAALPGIEAALPKPVSLTCLAVPPGCRPAEALAQARSRLAERFLFADAATWPGGNLARLLAAAAADPPAAPGRRAVGHDGEGDGICVLSRAALWREGLPATVLGGNFFNLTCPGNAARAWTELPGLLRRRALFLDRDGVINVDHGYVGTPDRFDFIPGALKTIRAATEAGWHVFVVTNQSGIARGLYDEAQFAALMDWVNDQVRAAGGTIDDVRSCPTHPEAPLAAYRRESDWRKPGPGMLLDLLARWELDPARCLLIGDQETDLAAAAAAGVTGHLFPGGDLADFAAPLLAAATIPDNRPFQPI